MKPIIIERNRDINKSVSVLSNMLYNNTIFIFDIHQTTLTKYGKPDEEVYKFIRYLHKHKYNIIFLSFDGNSKRIIKNNKLLNKVRFYRNIPRIFINKRNKQYVAYALSKLIDFDPKIRYKVILIDDNYKNIKDIQDMCNKKIVSYYYTKKY